MSEKNFGEEENGNLLEMMEVRERIAGFFY